MAHIIPDAGAQEQPDNGTRRRMKRYERGIGIEDAAAGKAHNVVEEAQGAVEATVLIVDFGINMPAVSSGDHAGYGLEVLFHPAPEYDTRNRGNPRPGVSLSQRQHHKQAGKLLKAFLHKRFAEHAGLVGKELRLNALYTGRTLQGVNHMTGQAPLHSVAGKR